MKRIYLALKEKWPEYILEIFVLIIGIIGAFQLENYGQEQARKKEEIEILKGCRTELMTDLKDIEMNITELTQSIRSINIILSSLENDISYHDSLAYHFNYTFLPLHWVHSTSTFETLRSRGLDIVSNDSIRFQLVNLYDSQYKFFLQGEAEELEQVHYCMKNLFPGRFEASWNYDAGPDFTGELIPLDYESLKTDTEYLYFVKTQLNRTRSYVDFFYFNLNAAVVQMIEQIDNELNRLGG